MLWFDFFNHDSERVIQNMEAFQTHVVPLIEDNPHEAPRRRTLSLQPTRREHARYNRPRRGLAAFGGLSPKWREETTIHGAVARFRPRHHPFFRGNVLCCGGAKPFMICMDELGAVTNWKQRAISVSSHNGDAIHVEAAQSCSEALGAYANPAGRASSVGKSVVLAVGFTPGEHAAIFEAARKRDGHSPGILQHHPFLVLPKQVRRFGP